MEKFYLRVLGKPEILALGVPVDRLRTRRLWGVLAYLALSPSPVTRSVLAQTFWPDVDDPRTNLKVALSSLRTQLPSLLEESKSGLRLADGVACDAVEICERVRCAKQAPGRQERRHFLEEAAQRERGEFLEGIDGDWALQQRAYFYHECCEFFEELMTLQQEDGDLKAAAHTAERLLRFQFDHPEALRLTLAHTSHQVLAERATLDRLLSTSFASWSASRLFCLRALAVFPTVFTAEAAVAVTGITPPDLKEAMRNGIIAKEGLSLSISGIARERFWGELTEGQKRSVRKVHATWIVEDILSRAPDKLHAMFAPHLNKWSTIETTRSLDEIQTYIRDWEADIRTACRYCVEHDDIDNADIFYLLLCQYLQQERHSVVEFIPILTKRWETIQRRPYYFEAVTLMALLSVRDRRLEPYFQELLDNFVNTDLSFDPNSLLAATETALIFFHHNGEDEEFDRVFRHRIELLKRFPDYPITAAAHHMIAENSLARKRFAHALLHNQHFYEHWREQNAPNSQAVGLLQRGAIFKGLEQTREARLCWNEALLLYEEVGNLHGQASCLEVLANLHRENQAFGEAQVLLREAIRLFQQSGDKAAVFATEGSLGDVLRDRGRLDEAEMLYRQGLEFWKERGHTRWVRRFEERLTNMHERREISIK